MKLCKDCKHFFWPTLPYQAQSYIQIAYYREAMCSHPGARRNVVTGDLEVRCSVARGEIWITDATLDPRTRDIICGMDAQLFEPRPPAPEPKPRIETEDPPRAAGFWEAFIGNIFG